MPTEASESSWPAWQPTVVPLSDDVPVCSSSAPGGCTYFVFADEILPPLGYVGVLRVALRARGGDAILAASQGAPPTFDPDSETAPVIADAWDDDAFAANAELHELTLTHASHLRGAGTRSACHEGDPRVPRPRVLLRKRA